MTKRTWLRSRRSTTLAVGNTDLDVRSTTLANAIPLSNWHFDRYYANNRYYGGVYSRDSIPKRIGAKFYIINLDDSTGPGTHWVALYNVGRKPIYFDSFGVWPPKELMKIKNLLFNDYRIQSRNSRSCGLYCIYVCDQLLAGREFIDINIAKSSTIFRAFIRLYFLC